MKYGQLGLMDAICFSFGLILEIPSGAIADIIGKRRTIIFAMLLAAVGFFLMGSANGLPQLWIGFLFAQAGWAFYSGAAEALAFDSLVDRKKEHNFAAVIAVSGSIATVTVLLATSLGGFLYAFYFRSTHLAMALSYIVAWFISLGLQEPKTDTEKFTLRTWFRTLQDGIQQLFVPEVRPFIVVIFMLMGAEYIYDWGFLKPAIAASFGYLDKGQAVIFTLLGIMNALLLRALPSIRTLVNDKKGLYMLTILMGIGFILASLPLGYWGLAPMLIISITGCLVYPWISIVVNTSIEAKHRATALSAVTFITKVPYILVAILAGNMIEKGSLWLFNLIVGTVIILAIVASTRYFSGKKVR